MIAFGPETVLYAVQSAPLPGAQAQAPAPTQTQAPSAQSQAPAALTPAPVPGGYLQYLAGGFSVCYPEDWSVIDDFEGLIVAFLSPLNGEEDFFSENVNFVYEDLPAGTDLAAYAAAASGQITGAIPDAVFESEGDAVLNARPAKLLVYSGTSEGTLLKWMQIYTVAGNRAYVFTYTAEYASYLQYEAAARTIADTLRILQ